MVVICLSSVLSKAVPGIITPSALLPGESNTITLSTATVAVSGSAQPELSIKNSCALLIV